MCGRLSQYRGIHDFVAALSIPNALINYAGDQPFERYNAAPTTQRALFHRDGEYLRADMVRWGWRPHWAKDRAAPINARVEKVAHGPFFKAIWPHRAIIAIDNWFEWVYEGGPKKQPYLIRHRDGTPILCAAIGQYPIGEHEPGEHDGFVIITADSTGGYGRHSRPAASNVIAGTGPGMAGPGHAQGARRTDSPASGRANRGVRVVPVDRAVGNVRNQGRDLIEPVGELKSGQQP